MLNNWNLRRILYLIGGIAFTIIAIKDQTWWMIIFGVYFAAMAIFRFGCASGNCEVNFDETQSKKEHLTNESTKN